MKYFVVSDIHGFFKELHKALLGSGFEKRNKNHTLVICGDVFDRGPDTIALYRYLKTIPSKRLILVKGNHESLYLELLRKSFPDGYDFSNHTVDTFCQIAGVSIDSLRKSTWYELKDPDPYARVMEAWKEIVKAVKESPITDWLKSNKWRNYFELDRYIFVHSFIPLRNVDGLSPYYIDNRCFKYFADWRESATDYEWYSAAWGCPYRQYLDGYFKEEAAKGKVLVCGHWVVTDFRQYINNKLDFGNPDVKTYRYENIIGLDCGVWREADDSLWHPQNVLILDSDDFDNPMHWHDGMIEELAEETSVPRIETITR